MKKNKRLNRLSEQFYTIIGIFFGVMLFETIAVFCINRNFIALIVNVVAIIILGVVFAVFKHQINRYIYNFFSDVMDQMSQSDSALLRNFNLPVLILKDNEVFWYNSRFHTQILKGNDAFGECPREIYNDSIASALKISGKAEIKLDSKFFSIYRSEFVKNKTPYSVLYFIDDTALKKIADEYSKSRPVIMIISIDSFDELTADLAESEQAAVRVSIEKALEEYIGQTTGFLRKMNNHRYMAIIDETNFNEIRGRKFDVLDKVRGLKFVNGNSATLSIGVGRSGNTLKECESMAYQALEMCQGRGGDQAAVKNNDGFEFFGGISSKGVEKRTKVKTRVISAALKELIRGSDSVFIVGHRFGDLDSMGASVGLWKATKEIGVKGYIVVDKDKNLAKQLIAKAEEKYENIFLSTAKAPSLVTKKSLVIVADTHRADFLDCPELVKLSPTVVIIDHHRKTVDYINNSVIFYHEPYASSTCEMVCELLQYMGDKIIGKCEADALLAGIMLDTRNFVLRTGVRTFEAAAYLRGKGADPVEVKKMFADSMEVYRERSAIVSAAKIYGRCAVAVDAASDSNSRVAASQAADELLNIENVDASFVIFETSDTANISARSLGKINVQLIMEALGGGGHHTMAAAQLKNTDTVSAEKMLLETITKVIGNNN